MDFIGASAAKTSPGRAAVAAVGSGPVPVSPPGPPPPPPPLAPTNTVAPVVSGSLAVGSTLTTTDGTWTNSPTAFAYQWKSNGSNVGTDADTYTTVSGDVGHTITATVTASNGAGSTPATSAAVGPITAAPTTTTFPNSNPAIVSNGRYSDPFPNAGIQIRQTLGANSYLAVRVTGTKCEVQGFMDGSAWAWTVDGGSVQTASPSGNTNQWLTLYDGLDDAPHTVLIYTGRYVAWSPDCLRVTGATPAIAVPTGYADPQYGTTDAGIQIDGSAFYAPANQGYINTVTRGSIRFKARTTSVRVWCVAAAATPQIALIAGKDWSTYQVANAPSNWGWVTFSGLDGSTEKTYRVIVGNNAYTTYVSAANVNSTPLTAFPMAYWSGDSETAASNITNGDCAPNYPQVFGIERDYGWQISASPGQTATSWGVPHAGDAGAATPAPTLVVNVWGVNADAGGLSEFEASCDTIAVTQRTDLPTAKIVFPYILPVTSTIPRRATWDAGLQSTIDALADANITTVNNDALAVLPTSDGTHLTAGTGGSAKTYGEWLATHLP
jgi:hypothetical protein